MPYHRDRSNDRTTATLWAEDGRIHIRTDYDADFVAKLKSLVPPAHRSWMPKPAKRWTFEPTWLDRVVELCERFFDDVTILEPEAPAVLSAGDDPYAALLRFASPSLLKKVYKELMAEHHPDRGGDSDNAVAINEAWRRIRQEKGI